MREGKFISIKYTRGYIYANFWTFISATRYKVELRRLNQRFMPKMLHKGLV